MAARDSPPYLVAVFFSTFQNFKKSTNSQAKLRYLLEKFLLFCRTTDGTGLKSEALT